MGTSSERPRRNFLHAENRANLRRSSKENQLGIVIGSNKWVTLLCGIGGEGYSGEQLENL